MGQSC